MVVGALGTSRYEGCRYMASMLHMQLAQALTPALLLPMWTKGAENESAARLSQGAVGICGDSRNMKGSSSGLWACV